MDTNQTHDSGEIQTGHACPFCKGRNATYTDNSFFQDANPRAGTAMIEAEEMECKDCGATWLS